MVAEGTGANLKLRFLFEAIGSLVDQIIALNHTVAGRNPAPRGMYMGCVKPRKSWDKLPISTGESRISEPSTVFPRFKAFWFDPPKTQWPEAYVASGWSRGWFCLLSLQWCGMFTRFRCACVLEKHGWVGFPWIKERFPSGVSIFVFLKYFFGSR